MNFAAALLVVSLFGTGSTVADHRQPLHRVKRDLQLGPPANNVQQNCVYVDISSTGKKTIVCGDPAPSTLPSPKPETAAGGLAVPAALAALSAAGSDDPVQQRRAEPRTFLDKCFGDKCDKKKAQPVAVVVQPQVRYEPFNVVQPPVNCPPVNCPPVNCPPVEVCQKPHVQYQLPVRYPCAQPQYGYYGGGPIGGYGGGVYGGFGGGPVMNYERTTDGYPPFARPSPETNRFVNDVPTVSGLQAVSPYDATAMAQHRRVNGIPRTRMRPTPVFIPGLTRRTAYVPPESGVEAPDAVRGLPDLEPQLPLDAVPQMQMPVARNGFESGPFDPYFGRIQYVIRPETPNFGRVLQLQPRNVEVQNFGGPQTGGQPSSGSGVDGDPADRKMMSDEQNVQQPSDAAPESDQIDHNNNNTKPSDYTKLDRVTRN